ncbi:hypothetical protein QYZ88_001995 [Lachnospiraceae bacterium C1.1]|nr:hypothetical protein [Lachnospiraceae bacterium C1.1]
MRVLFDNADVREVASAEVKPMDLGGGKIVGTQINFILYPTGDHMTVIYKDSISIEESGQRALDFIKTLYEKGYADLSNEPIEKL